METFRDYRPERERTSLWPSVGDLFAGFVIAVIGLGLFASAYAALH